MKYTKFVAITMALILINAVLLNSIQSNANIYGSTLITQEATAIVLSSVMGTTSTAIEGMTTTPSAVNKDAAITESVLDASTDGTSQKPIIHTSSQQYLFKTMDREITELKRYYKNTLTKEIIGYSVLKKPIYLLSIGNPQAKKRLLVTASTHAREYMTSQLVMKQIEYYLQNLNSKVDGVVMYEFLKATRIDFVPMLNPDGVDIAQLGLKGVPISYVSKLTTMNDRSGGTSYSQWKANAAGVDLNRNFSTLWSLISNPYSGPSSAMYRGVKPESEPESKSMVQLIRNNHYSALISYHAMGEIIYWYQNQTGLALKRDKAIADVLKKQTGYALVNTNRPGYGGLRDWFVSTYKKPGFTIEIGANVPCPVPISQFKRIWMQNRFIPIELSKNITP